MSSNSSARDRPCRREALAAASARRVALVCLLAAAATAPAVTAAPSLAEDNVRFRSSNNVSYWHKYKDDCGVSLQLGERSGGGQLVTVSAPHHCHCKELQLGVFQRRGIPCPPGDQSCAWMTAHSVRASQISTATFLVSVGGLFRARALCLPPKYVRHRQRQGLRRSLLLLDNNNPVAIHGIALPSWNVTLAGRMRDDRLVVRVLRQMDARDSDAYFPELFVSLYRPADNPRWPPRRVVQRRVKFSPDKRGARVEFTNVTLSSLYGWTVDARPADSWVCQGANDGCQKRFALVKDLLELTERALTNIRIEA